MFYDQVFYFKNTMDFHLRVRPLDGLHALPLRLHVCDDHVQVGMTFAQGGLPGDAKRVLAIHNPLRHEFCERSACSGSLVDRKSPLAMALIHSQISFS